MVIVCTIFKWDICIQYVDYLIPHVIVKNEDYKNIFGIENSEPLHNLYGLHGKELRLIQAWMEEHKKKLYEAWNSSKFGDHIENYSFSKKIGINYFK